MNTDDPKSNCDPGFTVTQKCPMNTGSHALKQDHTQAKKEMPTSPDYRIIVRLTCEATLER
jgi:hypothetical protein